MTTLLSSIRKSTLSFLATSAVLLPGCIALPVPLALRDPEPFTAERMASVRLGETTRDEVRALLADWTYETDDGVQTAHLEPEIVEGGRYWAFRLPRETADILWVGLALVPEATVPVPVPFAVGKENNQKDFWLMFEFDDEATVTRFWIAGDRTKCAVGGACYHDGRLQIIGDEAADASARAGIAASDRCVVYAYADDDFELPVTVGDGPNRGGLLAESSFVRFDVAVSGPMPSAWYDNAPGSAVTMPIGCAGGEVHYVALQPKAGLIEAVPQAQSTGARAIKKRYVVDHLVPVHTSQPQEDRRSIATHCTTAEPCGEVALLDLAASQSVVAAVLDAHEQSLPLVDYLLLRPGRYTVQSRMNYVAIDRRETIDLAAGQSYRAAHQILYCGPIGSSPSERRLRKEPLLSVCNGSQRDARNNYVGTTWIEDRATNRVVLGDKWCVSDANCPASACSLQPREVVGVCEVAKLP